MSGIAVRRLTGSDDVAGAADLLIRFFREEQFDTPDDVIRRNTRSMAGLDNCGLFIAENAGQAIGVATISLEFGIEFGWGGEMGDLYVLPDWRGKGVSRKLVLAIEDFLKGRGATTYQVTVTPYAQDAHDLKAFYSALGFETEGRLILAKEI
ncbi:GNAT family N-acetyltransferase [Taklimakanibacter lacteus]|uniref:GNAT family N-acetyltransferase n=1 Tax=Taklimakanibacter lacteus TaxID=2268456 RepID=UPI000E66C84D